MEPLTALWLGTPVWIWLAFIGIVIALLVLDLGVLHRKQREIGVRESLVMSGFYITLGLCFGAWVWWYMGATAGMNYITGFVIEKSLAMDNVFVIAMIFAYFGIPRLYQHRVLFWGVLGVIVLRAIMIGFGAAAVQEWDWVLYLFAGFLILTGIKMWRSADEQYDVGASPILRWVRRRFRVTDTLHGQRFWVRQPDPATGRVAWFMTPLFLALIMIEFVDVVFAVDSVPAIFAITTDPFIVYTSNIFAILGLRALYFALAAMVDRFHYLKYALSLLLVFIGSKIFVADALGLAKIPPPVSLGITFAILAGGVAWSLWKTRGQGIPARVEGA
ncbi:TerC family protein [Parafrankia sp. BMG5.11]|uniref:TerC family protein n=1 Tax=Parafrankia sp. BMG5.11 TaxID=222540 RepID=UPI00103B44BF|nr:TerC family protein [Parafrankia sp. BMG5.11]TCJ41389.1 TerC family protein [Parafrankia sp. BMG5.11]